MARGGSGDVDAQPLPRRDIPASVIMESNSSKCVETNLITLSRHVLHSEKTYAGASGDLTLLLVSIQVACKFISSQVRQAGLANL